MSEQAYIKCRISLELVDSLMTRDVDGNLVTYELSEPYEDGFRDLIFTVHRDDNPLRDALAEIARLRFIVRHASEFWYEDQRGEHWTDDTDDFIGQYDQEVIE